MERLGHTRVIQGGGSGAGFEAPGSLVLVEPKKFKSICSKLLDQADYVVRECQNEMDKNRFDTWRVVLARRMYKLSRLRKWEKSGMKANHKKDMRNHVEIAPDGTNYVLNQNTEQFIPIARDIDEVGKVNGDYVLNKQQEKDSLDLRMSCSKVFRQKRNSRPIRKVIPGFRNQTTTSLVRMWRYGTADTNYTPLWELHSADGRRKNWNGISNRDWVHGGQKAAFHRHQKFIRIVASYSKGKIRNIHCRGADNDWESAVSDFQETNAGMLPS